MKEVLIKQIDSLKLEHQNQIQQLLNQITSLQENQLNNIAQFDELEMIKKWISDKQINLKLIHTATANGFQFEKIYEKCSDKCKVILLVKTKEGRRLGFYADCFKNQNGLWQLQYPNNIFLISLELKQKYTSNESNCQEAFYSSSLNILLGQGRDFHLFTNSNRNDTSYVNQKSHCQKEGLTGHALNGGIRNFTTSEVEIFEVI
ncbi:hypothetical protein ABPG72_009301 [Tetrahymena utriculariae]